MLPVNDSERNQASCQKKMARSLSSGSACDAVAAAIPALSAAPCSLMTSTTRRLFDGKYLYIVIFATRDSAMIRSIPTA